MNRMNLKPRRFPTGALAALALLAATGSLSAGSFESPATLSFKLNSPSVMVTREQMRQTLAAAGSGGLGSASAQTQTTMNNVVQITENYEIVLNGDNNVVRGGGYNGDQASTGTQQSSDNQVNTNSTVKNVRGSGTTTVTEKRSLPLVLNP